MDTLSLTFLGAAGAGGMAMNNRDRFGDTYANNTTKKMIALYDYDPQVNFQKYSQFQ